MSVSLDQQTCIQLNYSSASIWKALLTKVATKCVSVKHPLILCIETYRPGVHREVFHPADIQDLLCCCYDCVSCCILSPPPHSLSLTLAMRCIDKSGREGCCHLRTAQLSFAAKCCMLQISRSVTGMSATIKLAHSSNSLRHCLLNPWQLSQTAASNRDM